MNSQEILRAINKLPRQNRILLIEKALTNIRKSDETNELETAANALYNDYKEDKELTTFTNLDFEDFYETRRDLAN